jgi:UDP-glucuronate 4-epimerase
LLGKPALYDSVGMQPGDMSTTFADTTELEHITGFKPAVSIEEGLQAFVEWYKTYYKL